MPTESAISSGSKRVKHDGDVYYATGFDFFAIKIKKKSIKSYLITITPKFHYSLPSQMFLCLYQGYKLGYFVLKTLE
jgi:hypothetical protein